MKKNKRFNTVLKLSLVWLSSMIIMFSISSCGDDISTIINDVTTTKVTAKERLDSATAQAIRDYGVSTSLVLIYGKNVNSDGTTTLSPINAINDPSTIGAWLYVFRVPGDTSLRIYTPNPLPTTTDCIELTAFFNPTQLVGLIQDTSARNIVSGALDVIIAANISLTIPSPVLIDSDNSLNLAASTNPVIKFDNNFVPDTSSLNGNAFFSAGTSKEINMFLIPAAGTLDLPNFIQNLTGFPDDMWVVQYKKVSGSTQQNLILGTVVQSGQIMGVPIGVQSPVINLSKYVSE